MMEMEQRRDRMEQLKVLMMGRMIGQLKDRMLGQLKDWMI
jgi:hypothetical protein